MGIPGPSRSVYYYEVYLPEKETMPIQIEIPWTEMNDYISENNLIGMSMIEVMIHNTVNAIQQFHGITPTVIRLNDGDAFLYRYDGQYTPIVKSGFEFHNIDYVKGTSRHFDNWMKTDECTWSDEEKVWRKLKYG